MAQIYGQNSATARTAQASGNQTVPVPLLDWPNGQTIAVSGTSAKSVAYSPAAAVRQDAGTPDVIWEVISTTDCWITLGTNPTAAKGAAGSHLLPASTLRYIYIPNGNL